LELCDYLKVLLCHLLFLRLRGLCALDLCPLVQRDLDEAHDSRWLVSIPPSRGKEASLNSRS
jgi:hypothetical protein